MFKNWYAEHVKNSEELAGQGVTRAHKDLGTADHGGDTLQKPAARHCLALDALMTTAYQIFQQRRGEPEAASQILMGMVGKKSKLRKATLRNVKVNAKLNNIKHQNCKGKHATVKCCTN